MRALRVCVCVRVCMCVCKNVGSTSTFKAKNSRFKNQFSLLWQTQSFDNTYIYIYIYRLVEEKTFFKNISATAFFC